MYNIKLYHYLLQTRALRVCTTCILPCVLTRHEGQNIRHKNNIQASNKSKYEDQSPVGEIRTGCCVLLCVHKTSLCLLLPSFSCNSTSSHLTPPVNSSVQRRRSKELSSNNRLPLQRSYGTGYQGTCSGQWNLGVRKVPPPGCLPCPLRNMGLHSIKECSETSFACATTDSPPTYPATVFVVIPSRLTMLSIAPQVASQPSDMIMN